MASEPSAANNGDAGSLARVADDGRQQEPVPNQKGAAIYGVEYLRRLAVLRITPEVLQGMFTDGNEIEGTRIRQGIPEGARYLRSWVDGPTGEIRMLFEHDRFDPIELGQVYPAIDVVIEKHYGPSG